MVNPELIRIYGVESLELFNKMVEEMGKDLAATCYVLEDSNVLSIDGVDIPNVMTSKSEKSSEIRWAIHTFAEKCGVSDDGFWVVLLENEPKEGDIKLWIE